MLKRLRYRGVLRAVDQNLKLIADDLANLHQIMPQVLTPIERRHRQVLLDTLTHAHAELLDLQRELQATVDARGLTRRQRFVRVMAIMDRCRGATNFWAAVQRVELDALPDSALPIGLRRGRADGMAGG